ncbi:hypothetical protein A33Q_3729 [Indibacter alkaliphilus LW1]|uniref:DUF1593 domain-containing protein n=1 Tax=Indibacter alkaliphilus (strain CCUG 57479 / KCTC 22604 / LW1) TaxID=1189612 RepID=S2D8V6_INDAL|nr:DUF1593 domain-containing protein [Indibacter alkaliphilus]EOZ93470.1 hypothetical protein A33Q_3729 [Indibacter alkaliphilus LW1]
MKDLLFFPLLLISLAISAQTSLEFKDPVKQRVLVLTDITNEPDDQQSLVRFLVYSNEYDVEGIVATTSTHLRDNTRKDKIEELIRNYGEVKANLDKHGDGFPSAEYLLSVTSEHLPLYSMDGVGEGKDSPGSELLIKAVDKEDDRPLWVSVWGGANCLAQALWKVKNTRTEEGIKKFVEKIKVYAISDQDFAGHWIRQNFPGIFYIVDASAGDNWREYYKATWTGIAGDKWYKNGPFHHFDLVDNPWLMENIRDNHGPLGANYLPSDYIMEGDTPSFIGLIQNGLSWYKSPAWGGWAGRYEHWQSYGEVAEIWTSSIDTQDEVQLPDGRKEASNQATIWRWRKAYQHDFAARMDWNISSTFKEANHNPILVLNGNEGKALGLGYAKEGETVRLSAKGSYDPDGDQLRYKWWVYKEASGFTGDLEFHNPFGEELIFEMPKLTSGKELHIILEVEDSGSPSLTSYRRVVLKNP